MAIMLIRFGTYLLGVLRQIRWRAFHRHPMSIVHDGWSDKLDLSGTRMLDLDDEPPCFDLRVIKCLGDIVDRAEWHSDNYNKTSKSCRRSCGASPKSVEYLYPMIPRVFHKYVSDNLDKFLTVGYSCLVGAESVILNKFR